MKRKFYEGVTHIVGLEFSYNDVIPRIIIDSHWSWLRLSIDIQLKTIGGLRGQNMMHIYDRDILDSICPEALERQDPHFD